MAPTSVDQDATATDSVWARIHVVNHRFEEAEQLDFLLLDNDIESRGATIGVRTEALDDIPYAFVVSK